MSQGPTIEEIRGLRAAIADDIVTTPVLRCAALESLLGGGTRVTAKLEFLQRTGTFKARGALATIRSLAPAQLQIGVTAVSAGNHAIATAFAARALGTTARVVMTRSANPARVAACRAYGGDVVHADDVHEAFALAERIREEEGRYLVQPFEGPGIALGTGTLGLEICEQVGEFDCLIVPVGGGGLIAGVANAVKQLRPACQVLGVEPRGADTMRLSLAAGEPQRIDRVRTIADSLGAPFAMPYSFELARRHVDRLVLVDDDQLRRTMGYLFRAMKIAVEPACAASTAALLWPLRDALRGKHVVLLMCGSNIDWETFATQAEFDDRIS
ncbi:MAG: threonine/serine dehydratase [Gammaproteobacteria bacterium]|nr:threonine/serine dehydratase [Gammaproteobacteria bacterium]MBT8094198.1 threonine/serine dehydratase [Gammaproteobacteria bacterium]MBT8105215.1 threonine/serine dehydratase [Gammaproteobacteria bacterium]NNF50081.1 threonine/serine dehydratase [Woeseiaceae bacterium]NNK25229.1 threonine/serine dehydratase [Woeseiaceae bacterium]